MAKVPTFLERLCYQTYRLQLTLLKDPGEDKATQRHRHDEDEGERQRSLCGFHHPQSHNAPQLHDGKHVHAPCLYLKQYSVFFIKIKYHPIHFNRQSYIIYVESKRHVEIH